MLLSEYNDPKSGIINFVRRISNNPTIGYDESVAQSENDIAHRNLAMLNLMKDFGNIHNEPDGIINFYFSACAVKMNCRELADAFELFMNLRRLGNGEEVLSIPLAKSMNALMQACGFYDDAGEFIFRVGLPEKSGVGGGIVATWSPPLNNRGNSAAGFPALELLTNMKGGAIF